MRRWVLGVILVLAAGAMMLALRSDDDFPEAAEEYMECLADFGYDNAFNEALVEGAPIWGGAEKLTFTNPGPDVTQPGFDSASAVCQKTVGGEDRLIILSD